LATGRPSSPQRGSNSDACWQLDAPSGKQSSVGRPLIVMADERHPSTSFPLFDGALQLGRVSWNKCTEALSPDRSSWTAFCASFQVSKAAAAKRKHGKKWKPRP
jgi:hypothetical protein